MSGGGCLSSCDKIADVWCYPTLSDKTEAEKMCTQIETDKDDAKICGSKFTCDDCTSTTVTDGSKCKWGINGRDKPFCVAKPCTGFCPPFEQIDSCEATCESDAMCCPKGYKCVNKQCIGATDEDRPTKPVKCKKPTVEICISGETKEAGDGCNTCRCEKNQWLCTEKSCLDTEVPVTTDESDSIPNVSSAGINGIVLWHFMFPSAVVFLALHA
jgi:hypothetical protein